MTLEQRVILTCDNCGKVQDARGSVGWYQVNLHPENVDTRTIVDGPRDSWDLCSQKCLSEWAQSRRR